MLSTFSKQALTRSANIPAHVKEFSNFFKGLAPTTPPSSRHLHPDSFKYPFLQNRGSFGGEGILLPPNTVQSLFSNEAIKSLMATLLAFGAGAGGGLLANGTKADGKDVTHSPDYEKKLAALPELLRKMEHMIQEMDKRITAHENDTQRLYSLEQQLGLLVKNFNRLTQVMKIELPELFFRDETIDVRTLTISFTDHTGKTEIKLTIPDDEKYPTKLAAVKALQLSGWKIVGITLSEEVMNEALEKNFKNSDSKIEQLSNRYNPQKLSQ